MSDYKERQENEIFTKVLKAGRRTYFFDVRETKAGDYYLTITESKKNFSENGEASFEKHKIYLYKEDFKSFSELFNESTNFILDEKEKKLSLKDITKTTKQLLILSLSILTKNYRKNFKTKRQPVGCLFLFKSIIEKYEDKASYFRLGLTIVSLSGIGRI